MQRLEISQSKEFIVPRPTSPPHLHLLFWTQRVISLDEQRHAIPKGQHNNCDVQGPAQPLIHKAGPRPRIGDHHVLEHRDVVVANVVQVATSDLVASQIRVFFNYRLDIVASSQFQDSCGTTSAMLDPRQIASDIWRHTYQSLIAVNEEWMFSRIKNNGHDFAHHGRRNSRFLRALHVKCMVSDAARCHKIEVVRLECGFAQGDDGFETESL